MIKMNYYSTFDNIVTDILVFDVLNFYYVPGSLVILIPFKARYVSYHGLSALILLCSNTELK